MYKDILIKTVNLWLGDIIVGVLPSFKNSPTMNRVNNIMGSFLGLDLSNYNILSEFSFLIPRFFGNYINDYVSDFIKMTGMSDEEIPKQFNEIVDSCILRCRETGHINVFGLQFEESAFGNLKTIFNNQLKSINTVNTQQQQPVVNN
jgi:hypothetical protein